MFKYLLVRWNHKEEELPAAMYFELVSDVTEPEKFVESRKVVVLYGGGIEWAERNNSLSTAETNDTPFTIDVPLEPGFSEFDIHRTEFEVMWHTALSV